MEYDYIIVGAGSAGCVMANRLSADPANRVLLLEAGPEDKNFWIHVPLGYGKNIVNPDVNWCFESEPEEYNFGRKYFLPRGKVLGGSSSINGMVYVRGQVEDFDTWAQMGCRGWSYDDVLPYFRKAEDNERGESDIHGVGGPLSVSDVNEKTDICDALIAAGVEAGIPFNNDVNGRVQEGIGYHQATIRNGKRCSAAVAYLNPVRARANLDVQPQATVKRVIFEGKKAVGVQYDQRGQDKQARATGAVVVSGGSFASPQILELSGIGRPEVLREHGIDVRAASPGVGENYRDHYAARMNWRINQPITLNQDTRGLRIVREALRYAFTRRGVLTFAAGIGHGFIRSRPELDTPDCQLFFAHGSFSDAKTRAFDKEPGMTIGVYQCRPESQGSIHIGSADPFAAPKVRANYLDDPIDCAALVGGMKLVRELGEAQAFAKYRSFEMTPGADCTSDDEILDYARRTGATTYHVMGTCKMGPDGDPMAVVTDRLAVRGVQGLRVVDASVMPTMPSGNINAPVIMVAEKAADMIIEDARANR